MLQYILELSVYCPQAYKRAVYQGSSQLSWCFIGSHNCICSFTKHLPRISCMCEMLGPQKQKIQLLSSKNSHSGGQTRCINPFCSGRYYDGVMPRLRISQEIGKKVLGGKVACERTQNIGSLVPFGTSGARGLRVSRRWAEEDQISMWQCWARCFQR